MKRAAPFVIAIFLAGLAFWFRDWWLPGRSPDSIFLGYVEAETSLISASASGKLSAVQVGKGQAVKEGDPLFAIDDAAAPAEVARAEAAVATAKANLANLETGRRPLEIEQIEAQLAEAEANVELARLEHNRVAKTMGSGATSYSQFDKSKATLDMAEARARQLRAAIASARLPARTDEITAAEARVLEAEATLQAARSRLGDHRASAPSDGLVESVFFTKGETVAAGQPAPPFCIVDPSHAPKR